MSMFSEIWMCFFCDMNFLKCGTLRGRLLKSSEALADDWNHSLVFFLVETNKFRFLNQPLVGQRILFTNDRRAKPLARCSAHSSKRHRFSVTGGLGSEYVMRCISLHLKRIRSCARQRWPQPQSGQEHQICMCSWKSVQVCPIFVRFLASFSWKLMVFKCTFLGNWRFAMRNFWEI